MYKWISNKPWVTAVFAGWCVLTAGTADVSGGTSTAAASTNQASPSTTITASKMTVRNQENKAIFEGTVTLTKGTLVVHSDVMVVFFKSGESAVDKTDDTKAKESERGGRSPEQLPIMSNRSVSMIEATGRVLIEKEDGRATCQKAVYHGDEEKIVLTGTPVAWQKGTRVTGKKITMFLAEDRSIVEGGSSVMIQQGGS
jgi:lipopolysaccharide export system protein LptA